MPDRLHGGPRRLDAIDFWRGYLLCTIFINHMPGNAFEPLTQKNFGFSDSAEGFVFISGLALALAYGRRFESGDWRGVTASLGRRSLMLYGLHVVLSLAGVAIFIAASAWGPGDGLLSVHGRGLAVTAPVEMVVGVVSLGHQFGYFNIMPLYIMMTAIAPVLLWLARAGRWPMLVASFALYVLAATRGWNLPNWPEPGTWFFDPFAWQFMVATGMALGLGMRTFDIPRSAPLAAVSAIIVGFGLFCVTDGLSFWPGLEDDVRTWAHIDKTTMGLGRFIHFAALAYLIYVLRLADWMRGSYAYQPLCIIGRNGLWIFCLLSLMAAAGQVAVQFAGHSACTDVFMVGAGLYLLYAAASRLESMRQSKPVLARREPSRGRAANPRIVGDWTDVLTAEKSSAAYAPR